MDNFKSDNILDFSNAGETLLKRAHELSQDGDFVEAMRMMRRLRPESCGHIEYARELGEQLILLNNGKAAYQALMRGLNATPDTQPDHIYTKYISTALRQMGFISAAANAIADYLDQEHLDKLYDERTERLAKKLIYDMIKPRLAKAPLDLGEARESGLYDHNQSPLSADRTAEHEASGTALNNILQFAPAQSDVDQPEYDDDGASEIIERAEKQRFGARMSSMESMSYLEPTSHLHKGFIKSLSMNSTYARMEQFAVARNGRAALALARRYKRHEGNTPYARALDAWAYYISGDANQAMQCLASALGMEKRQSHVLLVTAQILARSDPDQAAAALRMTMDKPNDMLFNMRAFRVAAEHDFDDVVMNINDAIMQFSPSDPTLALYYSLAFARSDGGLPMGRDIIGETDLYYPDDYVLGYYRRLFDETDSNDIANPDSMLFGEWNELSRLHSNDRDVILDAKDRLSALAALQWGLYQKWFLIFTETCSMLMDSAAPEARSLIYDAVCSPEICEDFRRELIGDIELFDYPRPMWTLRLGQLFYGHWGDDAMRYARFEENRVIIHAMRLSAAPYSVIANLATRALSSKAYNDLSLTARVHALTDAADIFSFKKPWRIRHIDWSDPDQRQHAEAVYSILCELRESDYEVH